MNMLQGVKNIELIPAANEPIDITTRLAQLLDNSESVMASIAFWTFSFQKLTSIISPDCARAFQHPSSFLCVDIQEPTNIDSLATLNQNNINVYLNLRRLPLSLKKLTSSTGLLHTKVLIANKIDGSAEIWVGSHNWTQYALSGPNTEATLAVTCDRNSKLYAQMRDFIMAIKSQTCDRFDISLINEYKQIQADLKSSLNGERAVVIEVEAANAHSIGAEPIYIFGTEMDDYKSLSKVGGKVVVRIHDSVDGTHSIHNANIIQTGHMRSQTRGAAGLSFTDHRRYAFCTDRLIPVLERPQQIPRHVIETSGYFVTLQLDNKENRNVQVFEYEKPRRFNWVYDNEDPVFERMSIKGKKYSSQNGEPTDPPPKIQVPFFKHQNKSGSNYAKKEKYLELPLIEKRGKKDYTLIRDAIIKYE